MPPQQTVADMERRAEASDEEAAERRAVECGQDVGDDAEDALLGGERRESGVARS